MSETSLVLLFQDLTCLGVGYLCSCVCFMARNRRCVNICFFCMLLCNLTCVLYQLFSTALMCFMIQLICQVAFSCFILNINALSKISRFVVIDISAGPCTYGKIETEEGSVSYRSLPRLSNLIIPRGLVAASIDSTQAIFMGQLGALISTTIEHVIAPDIRYLCMLSCWIRLKIVY